MGGGESMGSKTSTVCQHPVYHPSPLKITTGKTPPGSYRHVEADKVRKALRGRDVFYGNELMVILKTCRCRIWVKVKNLPAATGERSVAHMAPGWLCVGSCTGTVTPQVLPTDGSDPPRPLYLNIWCKDVATLVTLIFHNVQHVSFCDLSGTRLLLFGFCSLSTPLTDKLQPFINDHSFITAWLKVCCKDSKLQRRSRRSMTCTHGFEVTSWLVDITLTPCA